MSLRAIGLLGPSSLLCLSACIFEAPESRALPDALIADRGPFDASPADAADAELGDAGDLGPSDRPEGDALPEDGVAPDVPEPDAGQGPLASAGPDQRVCPGVTVIIDGSASRGDALSFLWTQTDGPLISLADPTAASTSFVAPGAGSIELELSVQNDLGLDLDRTQVEVEAAPRFELGPPRRVVSGAAVSLTVPSATTTAAAVSFAWVQQSGPPVALTGADTATVSFTAPAPGDLIELELTLTSTCGETGSDTILIAVNRPPTVVTGDPVYVLPHDTVVLDATSSTDPDGDTLLYEWTYISGPTGHTGGFEPFPGSGNTFSFSGAPMFYPTVPGFYFLNVEVSDGLETDSVATFVEVAPIALLNYSGGTAPSDSRALAVRPEDGHVFLGTQAGALEFRFGSNDVVNLACIDADQVSVVRAAPDGRVYFGFNDERRITELAAGGGCVSQTHDPGSVLNPNPASTRDLLVMPSGDLYVATNTGGAFFSRTSTAFTTEIFYTTLGGPGSDLAAVGLDGSGFVWFGSRQPGPAEDGAVRVPDPLTAPTVTPRFDFLTGSDDIHAFTTGLVALPAANEFWVFSRTRGALRIVDANSPQSFQQYTIQNGGLPPALLQDELTRGVFDPATQDVWIAMRFGLARYKRDVDAFVAIPVGVLGVSGRVYDLAFDQGTSRGRHLYIATENGVLRSSTRP